MIGMDTRVPKYELQDRMNRFRERMCEKHPDWELSVIFGNVNLYYYTGTMQDGILTIPRDDDPVFWVRRSYERACNESEFDTITPMKSFRDAAKNFPSFPASIFLETEVVPLALYERFKKHFPIPNVQSLDRDTAMVRAVKSRYELTLMEKAGEIHGRVLEEVVPGMLTVGMDEAEFASTLYSVLVKEGHHGITRFGMFNVEMLLGQIGFGENSLYPTYFDGPGGSVGMCPAVPLLGSRKRKLKKGDLVFVDVGVGYGGYHTDKTMTYMFGRSLPDAVVAQHNRCVEIQDSLACLLVPGNTPEMAYNTIMATLEDAFQENFMGFKDRKVKFLGHGIGLQVDEIPVIAQGFTEPFEEGMVFALEPKKGIPEIGMVGTENTYVVTKSGGRCITGEGKGLIPVY